MGRGFFANANFSTHRFRSRSHPAAVVVDVVDLSTAIDPLQRRVRQPRFGKSLAVYYVCAGSSKRLETWTIRNQNLFKPCWNCFERTFYFWNNSNCYFVAKRFFLPVQYAVTRGVAIFHKNWSYSIYHQMQIFYKYYSYFTKKFVFIVLYLRSLSWSV